MPDTRPRGLLVPAWRKSHAALVVCHGRFQGMTVPEVAQEVGCSLDVARASLIDGVEPEVPQSRGRKVTPETLERRRAAGIPEHLLHKSIAEIARALGRTQHQVNSAIYRNGPKLNDRL